MYIHMFYAVIQNMILILNFQFHASIDGMSENVDSEMIILTKNCNHVNFIAVTSY